MAYILENTAESDRLKLQDKISAYDLNLDLKDFDIQLNHKVLDAGCGTGIVSLFLQKNFKFEQLESCDFSDLRLKQAENYLIENSVKCPNFFQCDLEQIPKCPENYDRIVCRFVYEYLKNPIEVTKELHRVCKRNGQVRLIDVDGVVCNFQTNNSELNKMLIHFTEKSLSDHHLDFFAGRKLYNYMKQAEFRNIDYTVRPMLFKGEDLELEILNYRERFLFARELLNNVFGTPKSAQRFVDMYLEEMGKNDSLLFYNNFVVTGTK